MANGSPNNDWVILPVVKEVELPSNTKVDCGDIASTSKQAEADSAEALVLESKKMAQGSWATNSNTEDASR